MLRCLIIDDDELGRELLAAQLESYAVCDLAADGYEGVAKFAAALLEGNPYQVIFLDIVMPGMDGHAAAKAIRGLEQERGIVVEHGVNIVVLSALNTPQDIIQAYVSAQSAAHLVKPVKPERLLKTLCKMGLISESVL
ncbi:MAG: response regulator [Geobacter sp.]|uniref:response regulator n=1 Tax=Trichlorobacter sp. TaxID=2911007 RepID=UPI002A35BDB4|nr:response regulator [Trichlorobacter sp.]MDY0385502.1 response regulator [Trichlorobacter sp.]